MVEVECSFTEKSDSSMRPDWNSDKLINAKYENRSNRNSVPSSSVCEINSKISINKIRTINKPKEIEKAKIIRGLCEIDGKVVKFLADTGASQSILPEEHSVSNKNLKPFTRRAVTANNEELKINGEKECNIRLGDTVCQANVLVSSEVKDEFLMGIDYLSKCEVTKPHVDNLRKAINEASEELLNEFKQLKKELPFQDVEDIKSILTSVEPQKALVNECYDTLVNDYVVVQTASEIEAEMIREIKSCLELTVRHIGANGVHDISTTNMIEHDIEIIPGTVPIRQKRRPIPPHYIDKFQETIREMEKAGLIEQSNSPWTSPIHIVRKEGGGIRITQDYKRLNAVTVKDAYPLPNINNMLNRLSNAKIFSKLDLTHGYWQIPLSERSRKYTAFASEAGFHQFRVLPMGLTNACATFQRLMDKVLGELVSKICFVYLDDVIIFSENLEDHLKHVKLIVERLEKANLKIKLEKCEFAVSKIEYLSHIIEKGAITPNPKKVAHVRDMKPPKTIRKLKGFLGYASYYRKYIKNFSSIASPLIRATIRTKVVKWTEECQNAFDELKRILTSELVLQLPDFSKPFKLDTDACDYGVGASLEQPIIEGCKESKPVAYFSKHLSETQQRYSTTERELLAIVLACEHFRQMLYGVKFQVVTDHQPLKAIFTSSNLSPRLTRWLSRIEMFDPEIVYKEGKKHGNADGLSRMAVDETNDEYENIPATPINRVWVNEEVKDAFNISDDDDDWISMDEDDLDDETPRENKVNICQRINLINVRSETVDLEQQQDSNIVWIYNLIKTETFNKIKTEVTTFENKEQESFYKQRQRLRIINKQLYREFMDENESVVLQYVVPRHMRDLFLKKAHDSIYGAHQGRDKVLARLKSRCYWPKMGKDVEEHVKYCHVCQITKPPARYNVAELKPILPTKPLEIITTDIMGPLNVTKHNNKYIMIVVDHFTKWMELYALKTMEAEEVAKKIASFACRHGSPLQILSDQGKNYQSDVLNELYEVFDIDKTRTTPYHPACDGLSERGNRTNKAALTALVNERMNDWDELLEFIQLAYNTSLNATTNCTPFELMYGRQPRIPLDLIIPEMTIDLQISPEQYAAQVKTALADAYRLVEKNRDNRMERNKIYHSRKVRAAHYLPGDTVLLLDEAKKTGTSNKFCKKWKGPFSVLEVDETGHNVKIKPIKRNGRSLRVNISKLKTYFRKGPDRGKVKLLLNLPSAHSN